MSLAVPDQLTANREFMFLYRLALLGTTDRQRESIDSLIALAFSAGEISGVQMSIEAQREATT